MDQLKKPVITPKLFERSSFFFMCKNYGKTRKCLKDRELNNFLSPDFYVHFTPNGPKMPTGSKEND